MLFVGIGWGVVLLFLIWVTFRTIEAFFYWDGVKEIRGSRSFNTFGFALFHFCTAFVFFTTGLRPAAVAFMACSLNNFCSIIHYLNHLNSKI